MREVTFKDFAAVAKKRGHTVESLADRFRGKIENPSEFFERAMTCRYKGEDRSSLVIPYRSVLEFYNEEFHYFRDSNQKPRQCACGSMKPYLIYGATTWRNRRRLTFTPNEHRKTNTARLSRSGVYRIDAYDPRNPDKKRR